MQEEECRTNTFISNLQVTNICEMVHWNYLQSVCKECLQTAFVKQPPGYFNKHRVVCDVKKQY